MNKLLKFTIGKYDFLSILLFSSIFIFLSIITWGHLGEPVVDCGREFYIPMKMLQGKILIKDIFYLYNPLAEQINALLYKLLGTKISVLYLAGTINAYLILILTYLISRTLFKPFISSVVVLMTISLGVFGSGIFNYIMPYSYTSVYSLTAILCSIYFGILAIKNEARCNLFIYLSCLFLGLSLANKFDYYQVGLIILLIPAFFKKFKIKNYLLCLVLFILPTILSYSLLFLQGFSFDDLKNYITWGHKFFNSAMLLNFYHSVYLFSLKKYVFLNTIYFLSCFFFVWLNYKVVNFNLNKFSKTINFFLSILLLYLNYALLNHIYILGKLEFLFCWTIPFITLLGFLYLYSKRPIKNLFQDKEILICFFILICTILLSSRTNFFVNMYFYSPLIINMLTISLFIVILKFLPNLIKLKYKYFNYFIPILFIIFSTVILISTVQYRTSTYSFPIKTNKGLFYTSYVNAYTINSMLNYIENNVPKTATCLILPEGPFINFLADRKSVDKYYHLTPNHIETFGEENIINDLKKERPEYIFITNRTTKEYGVNYFCKDYAYKICEFIKSDYSFQQEINTNDSRGRSEMIPYISNVKIFKLK